MPTKSFATSGSYTVPAQITSLFIEAIAGGGGGGKATSNGAGGGGGGAYSNYTATGLTPGASIPYTVGTGGSGGTTSALGSNGSDSFWNDGSLCYATGGSKGPATTGGGIGGPAASDVGDVTTSGGHAGTGVAGTSGGGGGGGGSGTALADGGAGANGVTTTGGIGGTGTGAGGAAGNNGAIGSPGVAPGGGGGGGGNGQHSGAGAAGQISITFTIPNGATIYVDPTNGSDTNDGMSSGTALQTPTQAATNIGAATGCTIQYLAGSYDATTNQVIVPANTTFQGAGNTSIITGLRGLLTGMLVTALSNATINDLEISVGGTGSQSCGPIGLHGLHDANATGVVVNRLKIIGFSDGIYTQSDGVNPNSWTFNDGTVTSTWDTCTCFNTLNVVTLNNMSLTATGPASDGIDTTFTTCLKANGGTIYANNCLLTCSGGQAGNRCVDTIGTGGTIYLDAATALATSTPGGPNDYDYYADGGTIDLGGAVIPATKRLGTANGGVIQNYTISKSPSSSSLSLGLSLSM